MERTDYCEEHTLCVYPQMLLVFLEFESHRDEIVNLLVKKKDRTLWVSFNFSFDRFDSLKWNNTT